MMKRKFLAGTDLELSSICYGTALFGAELRGAALDACIRTYRDAGGNFFDTAHCYAFWLPAGTGSSERALGDYLRRNGKGDLIIGTKGGHPGLPGYRQCDHWLAPGIVAGDIDDSLERLGLVTLDLFWLHRDDTRLSPGEIVETLNREIRRGRIRHVGASNWRPARIAEANAYAAAHGLQGFVASQPQWNLAHRTQANPAPDRDDVNAMLFLEDTDLAWHHQSRLPVIPYSATAGGYFASGGVKSAGVYDNPVSRERLKRVQQLAGELGCHPGQVALAWLMNQELAVFPIIGPCNPDHLREDLGAADICLTPEQVAWLRG
ncbi:MAG: hypothetical protein A2269_06985 [Lentisphaerae bacterium RIFOXYA12_FULL_60_10]|nr:MAG: hypothetical protein A2269_06985 [Lentisphaerae bacterium RIFOXYA12_FULL_60_10]